MDILREGRRAALLASVAIAACAMVADLDACAVRQVAPTAASSPSGPAGGPSKRPVPSGSALRSIAASRYPTLRAPANPSTVTVTGTSLFGWALLDRDTGKVSGSTNRATVRNTIESMIKPWIAADYLRRISARGGKPTARALSDIRSMIIDSDNQVAQEYYVINGEDDSVERLITVCHLTDVSIKEKLWSWTLMTPLDATRYGLCLADGRAAGPAYTPWLLDVMTAVRGGVDEQTADTKQGGRWGIVDGLPPSLAENLSIKNGWTQYVDGWHVSCLAISAHWVLTVMVRTRKLPEAADACRSVARQLVVTRG